jgi:arylsulfate sulfotransferase
MYADSNYTAHQLVDTGSKFKQGPSLAFKTGSIPGDLFTEVPLQAAPAGTSNPVLLGTSASQGSVATDLDGRVLWYLPSGPITFLTRPEPGGYFWGFLEDFSNGPSTNVLRKLDLTGSVVLETNAARVSEQLAAMGKRPISGFHHEVRTLPDGRIAALASVEQVLTNVQGSGPVDVIGDVIVVLDKNLNVVWAWDSFDNLDVTRKAVLGETCSSFGGCSPHFLAKDANDWTHGNALQQTPDGNLLYSSRHQDWLIKIAYGNGEGDGHVIWRMGKDGDFAFVSDDTYPWFSHQHDGSFLPSDPATLLVYDDGNTRIGSLGSGHSRGQAFQVDEVNRTVTPLLNADLGVYSLAVGSAQHLRDGNFHFDSGFVPEDGATVTYSAEVEPSGNIVYQAKARTILYRTFRMTDLYSPN